MIKHIFKLYSQKFILSLLMVVTILVFSSCGITGNAANEIPKETNNKMEAYFCPKDDCGNVMEEMVMNATSSVHCALFDLDLKNIISAFSQKSKAADVRIVMDDTNNERQIKGSAVRFDTSSQLMHNKFCIFDNERIVTGSFNPTQNDNFRNNNNMLVIYSRQLSRNFESEFDELWSGKFSSGKKSKNTRFILNGNRVENYFCPEDRCEEKIIIEIKKAKSSIYFMSFSFTSEAIAENLAKKRGIDTRGVIDASQAGSKYSVHKKLQDAGISVKKDNSKYKMHHKVFIFDNETVATGSFNPTLSGNSRNDENLIIIHDREIVNEYLKEFESLY